MLKKLTILSLFVASSLTIAHAENMQPPSMADYNPAVECMKEEISEARDRAKTSATSGDKVKEAAAKEDSDEDRYKEESAVKYQDDSNLTNAELNPHTYYQAAVKGIREKKYQQALNAINKALELNPNYWDAWYQKALIFQLTGNIRPAIARYEKLLERKPDMTDAHINLGELYRQTDNIKGAEDQYRQAIGLKYKSLGAHFNLANLLMNQNRLEEALKEYKVCLKLAPTEASVHNNIGVIYQKRNYLEEAAEEFRKASNFEPANTAYVQNLNAVRAQLAKNKSKAVTM